MDIRIRNSVLVSSLIFLRSRINSFVHYLFISEIKSAIKFRINSKSDGFINNKINQIKHQISFQVCDQIIDQINNDILDPVSIQWDQIRNQIDNKIISTAIYSQLPLPKVMFLLESGSLNISPALNSAPIKDGTKLKIKF